MSTTRIMSGLVTMEGRTVNTLRVGDMTVRRPQPRYSTSCTQCGAQSSETHERLVSGAARCLSASHASIAKSRDRLAESENIAAVKRAELESAEHQASVARMSAETEGYERPSKYAPSPSAPALTSREVAAARERRAELEEEQRRIDAPRLAAEAEARERLALAESQLHETSSQLARIERDRVATGADDAFVVDPATVGEANAIPQAKVSAWQAAQFPLFLAANPDYYRSDVNAQALTDYIERNSPGLALVSAAQLTAAYKQLTKYGLLTKRPAPAPVKAAKPVTVEPAPAKPVAPGPKTYRGRDYETGLAREFSEREVARMSSEEYLRAFPILQSVSELFTAQSEQR